MQGEYQMLKNTGMYLFPIGAIFFGIVGAANAQTSNAPEQEPSPSDVGVERELAADDLLAPDSTGMTMESSRLEGLDSFLDGAAAALLETHDLPGMTVSVVADGEIVLAKGYGFADVARKRPVDPDTTLFRIGSTSKTFTWVAVMQLVEQGKLDLDADVNGYLTAFKIPEAFGKPITLRDILTHSAGFEDGVFGYLLRRSADDLMGIEPWLIKYMPARVRAPGTFSSYSNYGTALAGYIVAQISGVDFDTYVEENMFKPLGMNHSTFREPVQEVFASDLSENFARKGGDYEDAGFEFIHDAGPAGAVSSTAVDMAKWMLAHLGDGEYNNARILNADTARLMRTRLFVNHEALPAMLYGFYEESINGRFAYGHGGDTIAFHTNMLMLPEENVGIFVSTNAPDGGQARGEIVNAFFDQYFPLEGGYAHPAPANPETPDQEAMQDLVKYAGTYRGNRRSYSKWEKVATLLGSDASVSPSPRGGLLVSGGGGGQRYVAVGDGVFRSVDDADDMIAFGENESGEVTHYFVSAPFGAQDKISSMESAQTHQMVLGLCAFIFLGVILGSIWGAPKWLAMSGGEKLARAAVVGAAAVNLVFLVMFLSVFTGGLDTLIYVGLPNAAVMLTLPLIAAALAGVSAILLVPAWGQAYWTWFGRLRYTGVVLTLVLFAVILNYWNLFGPWYGW